jgi:anti-anti-sigma factor
MTRDGTVWQVGAAVPTPRLVPSQAAAGPLRVVPLSDDERAGLRVSGEIDLASHGVWEETLRGAPAGRTGDVHLDLAGLRFIDVGGTTLLVQAAASLADGQRFVLHDPPPCLRRVLESLWPEVTAVVIEGDAR